MHQTPGGMLSNFRTQLATAGLADRYDELLLEIAQVRSELAYPIMITPFAQFVGTQAAMNVMAGERYKMVPNEIKKYVLGYYGDLLAEIDPELRQKIIDNGASDIALEPSEPKPMLEDLAARYPDESIDHHLLRAMFAGSQVDEMKMAVASGGNPDEIPHPLLGIVKSLHATEPDRHPDPECRRPEDQHYQRRELTMSLNQPDIRELRALVDWAHTTTMCVNCRSNTETSNSSYRATSAPPWPRPPQRPWQ